MTYDTLKILHILSASFILGSIFYSWQLWLAMQRRENPYPFFYRIQKQTAFIIIPAALIQLATGFMLISLKHYAMSSAWIMTSLIGFIVLVTSWLAFVYFLVSSQQKAATKISKRQFRFYRFAQSFMLLICALSIAIMIYSMANRFMPGVL